MQFILFEDIGNSTDIHALKYSKVMKGTKDVITGMSPISVYSGSSVLLSKGQSCGEGYHIMGELQSSGELQQFCF